jgi:hypothetical protein
MYASRDFPKDPANLVRKDSPLDDLAHNVQNVATRARAVAADARSSAAEASARVISEQTVVSQYTAEHIASTNPHEEPYLAATVREAAKQKENAAAAAAATQAAYNTAILKQKEEVGNAAAWASQATEKALAEPMMKLQDWKMEVLHDPMSEAKIAAEKAAAPFREAVQKLHQRIAEYTKRAAALNSQAFSLQVAAKGTSGVAVAVMKKPTPAHWKTARTMMQQAQHMLMQAAIFNAQAKKLVVNAEVMELAFNAYKGGGEAAAQTAAHWYAPHLIAPAPTDGSIWAPPGPPLPFKFIQTEVATVRKKLDEVSTEVDEQSSKLHLASSDVTKASNEVPSKTSSAATKVHRKEGNPFQRRRAPV